MFVCTGRVKSCGRFLGLGEEIPDIAEWGPHSIRIHTLNGNIRDVTAEEAAEMRAVQADVDEKAKCARLIKEARRAKQKADVALGRAAALAERLAAAEDEYTKLQLEADEASAAAAGLSEPEPEPKAQDPDPVPPVPGQVDPPEPTPADRLAQAHAALGGYTKRQLVDNCVDWFGVEIESSGNKLAVRDRAAAVYVVCQPAIDAAKADYDGDPDDRAEFLKRAGHHAWIEHNAS